MRIARTLRATAAVAALSLTLAACGGDDANDDIDTSSASSEAPDTSSGDMIEAPATINEGQLTICSDIPYAPFEFEDETAASGYSGFDIELIGAMAAKMELELNVSVTGFDAIQSGAALAADACDAAASAMTITEEREENVDFVDAYFDADQSLMVKADAGITGLEDLGGALGVQADTTGQAYAEENYDGEIVEFPGAAELFAALEAGTIVGILQDLPVNAERAQADASLAIVATFPTGEQYGFAVKEGNTELLDALNAALAAVRADGTYDTLFAKYFEA